MTTRSIDTDLWTDPRVVTLSYAAKLVFVRMIAGPETTPAGVIRTTPDVIAAYLGMPPKTARASVVELLQAGLLREYDGWYWLPKFIHYQLSGPGFIVAIRRAMKGLPDGLQTAIDRAIVTKVGPEKARPEKVNSPTGKARKSRGKKVTPPDTPPVGQGSEGEKYQDQYQNQPFGLVGSGGADNDDEPPDTSAASPDPSPGAQAQPPKVEVNGNGNGNSGRDDGPRHLERPATFTEVAATSGSTVLQQLARRKGAA